LPYDVELLSIGNELLIGKVLNTNAQWLSKRITELGGRVTRIVTIGDDAREIASAIKEAIARRPRMIITTGGLGPTFDDTTLVGVGKALNMPLRIDKEALRALKAKYREIGHGIAVITKHRAKMARIPVGSKVINNPVGTAPGVLIEKSGTLVVCFPGVPEELRAMFDQTISPIIVAASRSRKFSELSLLLHGIPESELAPLIDRVMVTSPKVYIKSHPRGGEAGQAPRIELHFSSSLPKKEDPQRLIVDAAIEMIELLAKARKRTKGDCR
jgi:molybdenum cofactor synthesis domain-containing protein